MDENFRWESQRCFVKENVIMLYNVADSRVTFTIKDNIIVEGSITNNKVTYKSRT